MECPDCEGTGWACAPFCVCPRCGGEGYIEDDELEEGEEDDE